MLTKRAVIELAKNAQRRGNSENPISLSEANHLLDFVREYNIPSRGPEIHPDRPTVNFPHIHIGPVDHIRVRQP